MFPTVTPERTLKDEKELTGPLVSGYKPLLTVGTVSEGHKIIKEMFCRER